MNEINISNQPLKIENVTKENKIWKFITRLGGVLGILISAIAFYQVIFTEPSVNINYLNSYGTRIDSNNAKYLLFLKINVAGEDLLFQDISVEFGYEGGLKRKGKQFYPKNANSNLWSFGQEKKWLLAVPDEKLFLLQTVLEKNKTHVGYLPIIVNDEDGIDKLRPMSIQLVFSGSKSSLLSNKTKEYKSNKLDISRFDPMSAVFDQNIWIDVSSKNEIISNELRKRNVKNKITSMVSASDTAEFFRYFEGFILYTSDLLLKTENNKKD